MGLAATQARFLAITSRKAVCEYRSMELAQQKLSLSHEMELATENYNNSLNATRLVWDADGSGAYRYNLSYDLMTTPSAINQYMPYLLSRQDGKIAVNDTMRNALNGVIIDNGGIIYNGQIYHRGDLNYDTAKQAAYHAFIGNLRAQNAIPSAILNGIMVNGEYRYIEDAGLGGEPSLRETARTMHITSAISYIDNLVSAVDSGEYPAGSEEAALAEALTFNFGNCFLSGSWSNWNGATNLFLNDNYHSNNNYNSSTSNLFQSSMDLTLADLLNEQVALCTTIPSSASSDPNTSWVADYNGALNIIKQVIETNLDSIFDTNVHSISYNPTGGSSTGQCINIDVPNWYYDAANGTTFSYENLLNNSNAIVNTDSNRGLSSLSLAVINFVDKIAKSMYYLLMPDDNETTGIQASEANRLAFYFAMKSMLDRLDINSINTFNFNNELGEEGAKNTITESKKYNNIFLNMGTGSSNSFIGVSLSNLTEAFLTDFMNGMDNYEDGCIINRNAAQSVYITDFPEYLYTLNVPNANDDHIWEAEFYSTIFNNICQNGWYENQMLGEKSYLDNALKNGQLFVMSMADDYNYYQNRYAQIHGGHIVEETDEDAVAQAEREYTYLKSKINYKEERIEVETRSIDAELSTLNTEYETVKNLINKNVENAFKLFQS